mgnify:CR=1 FL=1
MNTRQLNFVWVVLMLATLATFGIGEVGERLGIAGPLAMAALLAISFVKGRLVMLDFMGLRGVKNIAQEFTVQSAPGQGTRVRAVFYLNMR